MGLHSCLGEGSLVSQLDKQVLVLIADEVLGGWSLMREWWGVRRREGTKMKSRGVLIGCRQVRVRA